MAAIYVAAARGGWAHIYGVETLGRLEPPVAAFEEAIASREPRQVVLIAQGESTIVGFAIIRPSQDEEPGEDVAGELNMLYTAPSVWGKGHGRRLLHSAVDEMIVIGFKQAILWTAEANDRPRRIYERAGWSLDGQTRVREWRGTSFREVRYRKNLSGV